MFNYCKFCMTLWTNYFTWTTPTLKKFPPPPSSIDLPWGGMYISWNLILQIIKLLTGTLPLALTKSIWLILLEWLTLGRPGDKGKNSGLEGLQREIAILKKVDHPYVVRLYEVCLHLLIRDPTLFVTIE